MKLDDSKKEWCSEMAEGQALELKLQKKLNRENKVGGTTVNTWTK